MEQALQELLGGELINLCFLSLFFFFYLCFRSFMKIGLVKSDTMLGKFTIKSTVLFPVSGGPVVSSANCVGL